jgi:hypothetical protein
MASSQQDPQAGHSLWLQRRSGLLPVRRVRWRSDWTPVGSVVLLVALLIALSLFLPTNKAVERVKQAAQADKTDQLPPVVGVLAEP